MATANLLQFVNAPVRMLVADTADSDETGGATGYSSSDGDNTAIKTAVAYVAPNEFAPPSEMHWTMNGRCLQPTASQGYELGFYYSSGLAAAPALIQNLLFTNATFFAGSGWIWVDVRIRPAWWISNLMFYQATARIIIDNGTGGVPVFDQTQHFGFTPLGAGLNPYTAGGSWQLSLRKTVALAGFDFIDIARQTCYLIGGRSAS